MSLSSRSPAQNQPNKQTENFTQQSPDLHKTSSTYSQAAEQGKAQLHAHLENEEE